MTAFELGGLVRLATHPDMIFKIVEIHRDDSYQIQLNSEFNQQLSYDHVPAEMLRNFDDSLLLMNELNSKLL